MNKPRLKEKPPKATKHLKQPPLWLRRLDLVKAEMKTVRFLRTAAEGFRQYVELSKTMRRWFLDSIRQEHPGASEEEIEKERRLLLAHFSAAETRRIARWKEECDRYLEDSLTTLLERVIAYFRHERAPSCL